MLPAGKVLKRGIPTVNQLKLKREATETDLEAALDRSVEAAVNLRISETDLVDRLLQRLHSKSPHRVVPLHIDALRNMYNPEAALKTDSLFPCKPIIVALSGGEAGDREATL